MTATPTVPVHCSHCAEPVLGAANRCWKCGQTLGGHAGGAPLVRRSAIPAEWLASPSPSIEPAAPNATPAGSTSDHPPTTDRPTTSPFAVVARAATSPTGDPRDTPLTLRRDHRPPPTPWLTTGTVASLALAFVLLFQYPWLAWVCAAAATTLSVAALRRGNRQSIFLLLVLACWLLSISTVRVVYNAATSRAVRQRPIAPGSQEFEPIDLQDE